MSICLDHPKRGPCYVSVGPKVSDAPKLSLGIAVSLGKAGDVSPPPVGVPNVGVGRGDPLPPALRGNGHYDVKINFELNSE